MNAMPTPKGVDKIPQSSYAIYHSSAIDKALLPNYFCTVKYYLESLKIRKMNKLILLFITVLAFTFSIKAQTTDTVSIGAGYANEVWYSLDSNEQAVATRADWDFGFQVPGVISSIIANTTIGELYTYPNGDTANWATLDTSGIDNWNPMHNSFTSWSLGAFNQGIDTSNWADLGWGEYHMNLGHIIVGDSLFVWKKHTGATYKVWIQSLISGSYSFIVSDLSGTNVDTISIAKSNYTGKNFAYYSIANDSVMDLEPLSADWDLLFSNYVGNSNGVPYPVSGIRTNNHVEAVKVYPVDDVNTYDYDSAQAQTYSSNIDVIGHDWKTFQFSTMSYVIEDSTVYILKTDSATYWKVVMKGFGGSANGNYIFEKTKLNAITGLFEKPNKNNGSFKIYPNPATNRNINIETDLPKIVKSADVNIYNINGQLVESKRVEINNQKEGILYTLDNHKSGIYFIQISHELGSTTQRLIIQ